MAVTRADNPRVNARSRPVPLSAAGSSRVATSPSERGRGRGAMSRRSFLGGGAAMATGMLSSCASDRSAGADGSSRNGADLRISTWVAYIDTDDHDDPFGKDTTLTRFQHTTGLDVDWRTDYNGNAEHWVRVFEPNLGRGRTIDADIVMPTFWMAARLVDRGWVEKIPSSRIPNRANLDPAYLGLPWDEGATHHLPWQAGITGIAYDIEATGRELGSFADLFDPEFAGRVGLLSEMEDTVGLTMLMQGRDPSVLDIDGANAALDHLATATRDGQIRAFTANEYLDRLISGEFIASMGWSGDLAQVAREHPNLRFVVPEEGAMLWFDTMMIPKGSPHVRAAASFMDSVYDVETAATITEYVQYISPVSGVQDAVASRGPEGEALAANELVFPTAATRERLHTFAGVGEAEHIALSYRFDDLAS